jgi:Co/Zn/Cd efflux system component
VVLVINSTMFVAGTAVGLYAHSLALLSDALDMLGDALTYGGSIIVVRSGVAAKARMAKFKAYIMLFFGAWILLGSIYKIFNPEVPNYLLMAVMGILALLANVTCLMLLAVHREDDINMKSVWVCSRNDIIANLSVLFAAVIVYLSDSPWPDLIVGVALAILFTRSALQILHEVQSAH